MTEEESRENIKKLVIALTEVFQGQRHDHIYKSVGIFLAKGLETAADWGFLTRDKKYSKFTLDSVSDATLDELTDLDWK